MRVVRILPVMVVLGMALLGGGETFARMADKSWEVGAYYGYGRFSNNSNVGGESLFGVRGSYALRSSSIIELDLDRGTAPHDLTKDIDFTITKIGVDYRHPFTLKGHEKVSPAMILGLGSISIDDGENSSSAIYFRVGGGFSYYFTRHLSARFDVRLFRFHGDDSVGARPPVPGPAIEGLQSRGMYAFDAVLGMAYAFGGK